MLPILPLLFPRDNVNYQGQPSAATAEQESQEGGEESVSQAKLEAVAALLGFTTSSTPSTADPRTVRPRRASVHRRVSFGLRSDASRHWRADALSTNALEGRCRTTAPCGEARQYSTACFAASATSGSTWMSAEPPAFAWAKQRCKVVYTEASPVIPAIPVPLQGIISSPAHPTPAATFRPSLAVASSSHSGANRQMTAAAAARLRRSHYRTAIANADSDRLPAIIRAVVAEARKLEDTRRPYIATSATKVQRNRAAALYTVTLHALSRRWGISIGDEKSRVAVLDCVRLISAVSGLRWHKLHHTTVSSIVECAAQVYRNRGLPGGDMTPLRDRLAAYLMLHTAEKASKCKDYLAVLQVAIAFEHERVGAPKLVRLTTVMRRLVLESIHSVRLTDLANDIEAHKMIRLMAGLLPHNHVPKDKAVPVRQLVYMLSRTIFELSKDDVPISLQEEALETSRVCATALDRLYKAPNRLRQVLRRSATTRDAVGICESLVSYVLRLRNSHSHIAAILQPLRELNLKLGNRMLLTLLRASRQLNQPALAAYALQSLKLSYLSQNAAFLPVPSLSKATPWLNQYSAAALIIHLAATGQIQEAEHIARALLPSAQDLLWPNIAGTSATTLWSDSKPTAYIFVAALVVARKAGKIGWAQRIWNAAIVAQRESWKTEAAWYLPQSAYTMMLALCVQEARYGLDRSNATHPFVKGWHGGFELSSRLHRPLPVPANQERHTNAKRFAWQLYQHLLYVASSPASAASEPQRPFVDQPVYAQLVKVFASDADLPVGGKPYRVRLTESKRVDPRLQEILRDMDQRGFSYPSALRQLSKPGGEVPEDGLEEIARLDLRSWRRRRTAYLEPEAEDSPADQ